MPPLPYLLYLAYYGVLLLACILTGCFLVRRSWPSWSKLLVILSCLTLVVESLTLILDLYNIHDRTMYNCWMFLETATVLYILSREASLPSVRRLFRALLIVLPPAAILCYILLPLVDRINVYVMLLYLFEELIAACAILVNVLKDISDTPMSGKPMFWLAAGMLFYSCLFIVVFSLGKFLRILYYPYYMPFSIAANTFMYGGFIGCFIALRRQGSKVLQE